MHKSNRQINTWVYYVSVFMILDLPSENYTLVRESTNTAIISSGRLPAPRPYCTALHITFILCQY
jgi:hypothetical protein